MALINYPKQEFEFYRQCPMDKLEDEISRASIRIKLAGTPLSAEERRQYQTELDRLTALKYINQLRRGKLAVEDFYKKMALI